MISNYIIVMIITSVVSSKQLGNLIIGGKEIYHPVQSVRTVNIHVEASSVQQVSNVAGVDSR